GARPARPRLESWATRGWAATMVDLVGCGTLQGSVRAVEVIPVHEGLKLRNEPASAERHSAENASALLFERADEPFDDGNAAVVADGAKALANAERATPGDQARATSTVDRDR